MESKLKLDVIMRAAKTPFVCHQKLFIAPQLADSAYCFVRVLLMLVVHKPMCITAKNGSLRNLATVLSLEITRLSRKRSFSPQFRKAAARMAATGWQLVDLLLYPCPLVPYATHAVP